MDISLRKSILLIGAVLFVAKLIETKSVTSTPQLATVTRSSSTTSKTQMRSIKPPASAVTNGTAKYQNKSRQLSGIDFGEVFMRKDKSLSSDSAKSSNQSLHGQDNEDSAKGRGLIYANTKFSYVTQPGYSQKPKFRYDRPQKYPNKNYQVQPVNRPRPMVAWSRDKGYQRTYNRNQVKYPDMIEVVELVDPKIKVIKSSTGDPKYKQVVPSYIQSNYGNEKLIPSHSDYKVIEPGVYIRDKQYSDYKTSTSSQQDYSYLNVIDPSDTEVDIETDSIVVAAPDDKILTEEAFEEDEDKVDETSKLPDFGSPVKPIPLTIPSIIKAAALAEIKGVGNGVNSDANTKLNVQPDVKVDQSAESDIPRSKPKESSPTDKTVVISGKEVEKSSKPSELGSPVETTPATIPSIIKASTLAELKSAIDGVNSAVNIGVNSQPNLKVEPSVELNGSRSVPKESSLGTILSAVPNIINAPATAELKGSVDGGNSGVNIGVNSQPNVKVEPSVELDATRSASKVPISEVIPLATPNIIKEPTTAELKGSVDGGNSAVNIAVNSQPNLKVEPSVELDAARSAPNTPPVETIPVAVPSIIKAPTTASLLGSVGGGNSAVNIGVNSQPNVKVEPSVELDAARSAPNTPPVETIPVAVPSIVKTPTTAELKGSVDGGNSAVNIDVNSQPNLKVKPSVELDATRSASKEPTIGAIPLVSPSIIKAPTTASLVGSVDGGNSAVNIGVNSQPSINVDSSVNLDASRFAPIGSMLGTTPLTVPSVIKAPTTASLIGSVDGGNSAVNIGVNSQPNVKVEPSVELDATRSAPNTPPVETIPSIIKTPTTAELSGSVGGGNSGVNIAVNSQPSLKVDSSVDLGTARSNPKGSSSDDTTVITNFPESESTSDIPESSLATLGSDAGGSKVAPEVAAKSGLRRGPSKGVDSKRNTPQEKPLDQLLKERLDRFGKRLNTTAEGLREIWNQ